MSYINKSQREAPIVEQFTRKGHNIMAMKGTGIEKVKKNSTIITQKNKIIELDRQNGHSSK